MKKSGKWKRKERKRKIEKTFLLAEDEGSNVIGWLRGIVSSDKTRKKMKKGKSDFFKKGALLLRQDKGRVAFRQSIKWVGLSDFWLGEEG